MGARLGLFAAVALAGLGVLLVQCSSAEWPELGTSEEPYIIDIGALDVTPGVTVTDPHGSQPQAGALVLQKFFDAGTLRPSVTRRHYPHLSTGPIPSNGIEVFRVDGETEFYLREDHMAGHYDAFMGPFPGDPKTALASASRPAAP